MPATATARKPGTPRKPRTTTEKKLASVLSTSSKQRRVVSSRDRRWVRLFADGGFRDADAAAVAAGFKDPYIGAKLLSRLGHLVEAEKVRLAMGEQMELEEALRLCAEGARDADDRKTQAIFLTLILRVHGALSDKPLSAIDRKRMNAELADLLSSVQSKIQMKPGSRVKLRAMLGARTSDGDGEGAVTTTAAASVEIESESGTDPASASASSVPLQLPILDIRARPSPEAPAPSAPAPLSSPPSRRGSGSSR